MAVAATDRHMPALQRKSGFAMARKAEIGGHEALYGMAVLTTVLVGSSGELAFKHVCAAVPAGLVLDAISGGLTGRQMTFIAGHRGVFALQRIGALCMCGDCERGRLP